MSIHRPFRVTIVVACGALACQAFLSSSVVADGKQGFKYPEARRSDHTDVYHGVTVSDPYRWLEEPFPYGEEVTRWIEDENKLTFGFLESIEGRDRIGKRLTKIWNYERYRTPWKKGGRYFFSKNDGLQNQNVLYVMDSLDSTPRVVLDPNTLSKDGTTALAGYTVTDDGKYIAYGIQAQGSDWQKWKVRNIDTGADLDDSIEWVKFSSASWTKDGKGFFYSRYDAPKEGAEFQEANYYHKLYYHKVGTPQSDDVLIYDRPDQKEWGFGGSVTDDGGYLIISVRLGTERKNLVFYKELKQPGAPVVELISKFESQYSFVDNMGPIFWFTTDDNAPNSRMIAIDIRKPQRSDWKEIIPERKEALRSVSSVGGHFIASYLKDAHSQIRVHDTEGKLVREVDLPGMGSAGGFSGKRDDTETFYSFSGYTDPGTIYRYDVATGARSVFRRPTVDFDPTLFETKQVFYKSKDGTKVPMFITHKKGMKLNGQNATYLYGYGGFNIPITPRFSPAIVVWLEMGGVFAVANIRGGGEYGKAWHEAGKKLTKQNCFDDFIAAAEWLIAEKYTSTPKLAIGGGSNGGLLVGACITQRPDLYGAALPAVGVMDMLRFHEFTIGWAWTSDYGCSTNEDEFKVLRSYSPVHNTKAGTSYPATMITTADHDDRVVPAHSFKFAAALQAAQSGPAPTLIRIQTKAGHGSGKPTWMIIDEAKDKWAFLAKTLGMEVPTW